MMLLNHYWHNDWEYFESDIEKYEYLYQKIENRLKDLNSQKIYQFTKNKISDQAFSLGFYILNSQNLYHVPPQSIFKTNDDFRSNYFPSYNPLNTNSYRAAKYFFDKAIEQ